jgi:hypothetical protein
LTENRINFQIFFVTIFLPKEDLKKSFFGAKKRKTFQDDIWVQDSRILRFKYLVLPVSGERLGNFLSISYFSPVN